MGQFDAFFAKIDLAQADAAQIQEVIDQMHHLRHLSLHHRADAIAGVLIAACQAHDLQAIANRGQRVPQLVGQRGEKLVFALVLLAQPDDQAITLLLAALALGDVHDHADESHRRAPLLTHGVAPVFQPDHRPVV